jgi:hypothetical protein
MNDATYFAVPSGSLLYMWFNCLTMDGESLRSASIGLSLLAAAADITARRSSHRETSRFMTMMMPTCCKSQVRSLDFTVSA